MNIKKSKKGFSLVELLVVITIIAILSVTAYVAMGGQTVKARDAKRKQDLSTIQSALELYALNNSRYPASLTYGTEGAPDYLLTKQYLSQIPTDPNGHNYAYALSVDNKSYNLGATLEIDGLLENYAAYIVGNSITLMKTTNGKYYNTTAKNLAACTDGTLMIPGDIIEAATTPLPNTPPTITDTCVPYDPRPVTP